MPYPLTRYSGSPDARGRGAALIQFNSPGALDIAMKRNDKEDQLGLAMMSAQSQAAAGKAKDDAKQQLERDKALGTRQAAMNAKTLFLPHSQMGIQMHNEYTDKLANYLRLHSQGKGGDPMTPGTPEWTDLNKMEHAFFQYADNSAQQQKAYELVSDVITKAPAGEFKPDAMQIFQKQVADPRTVLEGRIVDKPLGIWDFEGNFEKQFRWMVAGISEKAGLAGDGGTYSAQDKQVAWNSIIRKAVDFEKQGGGFAQAELVSRYVSLAPDNPLKLKADKIAAEYKISPGAAYAAQLAIDSYGAKQHTESRTAPSESGAGVKNKEAGLNWLARVTKSVTEGNFPTDGADGAPGISVNPFGGSGPMRQIRVIKGQDGIDKIDLFKGWTLAKGGGYVMLDSDGVKVKNDKNLLIKQTKYDRTKNEWVLETQTTDENGKAVDEERRVPYDTFESSVLPTLTAENEDKLEGIGAYSNTQETQGGLEQRNGVNIVGSNPAQSKANPYAKRPSVQSVKDDPYAKR